jgi:hypothetical protein
MINGHEVVGEVKIGRVNQYIHCLHPLERWDRGFESHSGHGYLSVFILCLYG